MDAQLSTLASTPKHHCSCVETQVRSWSSSLPRVEHLEKDRGGIGDQRERFVGLRDLLVGVVDCDQQLLQVVRNAVWLLLQDQTNTDGDRVEQGRVGARLSMK